jgi:CDP-diacylglycerol--serine O-phosphatidyltransferase
VAAFVYIACAALRLARFNVNTSVVDKRYFQGLPSPAAAALVMGYIWIMTELQWMDGTITWITFAVCLFSGLTMVTNLPYYSFKDIQMKKSVPFAAFVRIVRELWPKRLCGVRLPQSHRGANQRDQHIHR